MGLMLVPLVFAGLLGATCAMGPIVAPTIARILQREWRAVWPHR
ncbi:hypothetical protein [Glutamicibacter sp. V16R2B1]|nr:hypothetical protein [Glutamicibacter sp. V16R2B1]